MQSSYFTVSSSTKSPVAGLGANWTSELSQWETPMIADEDGCRSAGVATSTPTSPEIIKCLWMLSPTESSWHQEGYV